MTNFAIYRFNLYQLLRSPYLVFKHPCFSKLFSFVLFNQSKGLTFSSGTLKLFANDSFYKIGFVGGDICKERKNIELIRTKFPALFYYLPSIKFKRFFLLHSLKIQQYQSLRLDESLNCARQFLFECSSYSNMKVCSLDEFPNILHGVYLSKILYKTLDFEKTLLKVFSFSWKVGPVHGDFHMGNILVDQMGSPLIIDLDNFTTHGIQALDAFTFWVDYKCKQTNHSWQHIILSELSAGASEQEKSFKNTFFEHDLHYIALLYCLNRLGYENRYYRFLSRSVEREFRIISELINAIEKETNYGY